MDGKWLSTSESVNVPFKITLTALARPERSLGVTRARRHTDEHGCEATRFSVRSGPCPSYGCVLERRRKKFHADFGCGGTDLNCASDPPAKSQRCVQTFLLPTGTLQHVPTLRIGCGRRLRAV
jgi:hypothetical protein